MRLTQIILNSVSAMILAGGLMMSTAYADSSREVDVSVPIVSTVLGTGGTAATLIAMSRTKKRKTDANDNINCRNSVFTRSEMQYIKTTCVHKGK